MQALHQQGTEPLGLMKQQRGALAAAGDKGAAGKTYAEALRVAGGMAVGARQTWSARLGQKLQAVAP